MYVAGDHIIFGFPMAFTAAMFSWTILENGDQMKAVSQLEPARDSLKWITEYLVNAHPSDDVLYIQVLLSRVKFFGSEDISNSKILLKYRKSAEAVMCNLLPDSPTGTESKTNKGLIWINKWIALQHPVASAF